MTARKIDYAPCRTECPITIDSLAIFHYVLLIKVSEPHKRKESIEENTKYISNSKILSNNYCMNLNIHFSWNAKKWNVNLN